MLIGLVPLWGILPRWLLPMPGRSCWECYFTMVLNGRQISKLQMRELYARSLDEVRKWRIAFRPFHLPRLGSRRKRRALPASQRVSLPKLWATNAADATYCQYCGGVGEANLAPPLLCEHHFLLPHQLLLHLFHNQLQVLLVDT